MARYLKKSKHEIGLSPQELVFRGSRKIDEIGLRIIDFDESNVEEKSIKSVQEIVPYSKKESVTWFNIDGLHDLELLKEIGDQELRPMVMKSLSAVQLRLGQQMEALVTMQAGLDDVENPGLKQKLIKKVLRSPFSYFNRLS